MIYLDLTVLTEDPNRREDPQYTARRAKVRIDSVTGPFTEVEQSTSQRQLRPFSWYMGSRADINAFRAFLAERKGRLVPFWIPTWHHDLSLNAEALIATSEIVVDNINYTRHQFNDTETWRRHLAFIKIGSGVQFIKRIDGAIESTATEALTLNSALGEGLVPGDWMLSFLTLCRLETDDITLHWHSPTIAEAVFNVIELPNEMIPEPIA